MKINRSGLVILCMVLVVALCGTALGFAQGGGMIPGTSGETSSEAGQGPAVLPPPDIPPAGEELPEIDWSSSLEVTGIGLDKQEVLIGGKLELTIGLSGCEVGELYQAEATFAGLAEGEELTASRSETAPEADISLPVRLTVDGPADTYALRTIRLVAGDTELLFCSRGYDERGLEDRLLPQEVTFTAIDPLDAGDITLGASHFYLSDPQLAGKLQRLTSGAEATVLYGDKDRRIYLAGADVFAAAREKKLNLLFEDSGARWSFVSGAVKRAQEQDLEVSGEYSLASLEKLIDWKTPHYAFRIAGEGPLPGTAVLSLQVGQMSRFSGSGLYLYYYDEAQDSLQLVSGGISAPDGVLTFQAALRGVYVLCSGPAQPVRQEPSPQPEEKIEYPPIDEGDTEWFTIRDQLDEAPAGAMVSVRIERDEPIPYWIVRSLCGRDVKLSLSDGSSLVTLDGLTLDPPKRCPVFKLPELKALLEDGGVDAP